MKAIRVEKFGGPEVLQLVETETPQVGPSQVLLKVRAIGVNPVETYIRSGTYGNMVQPPYTPGSDAAGEVIAIGADVTDVQIGDRVYTWHPAVALMPSRWFASEKEFLPCRKMLHLSKARRLACLMRRRIAPYSGAAARNPAKAF